MVTVIAKIAYGGGGLLGDRMGIPEEIVNAVGAAVSADAGAPYERSELIPEVTRPR